MWASVSTRSLRCCSHFPCSRLPLPLPRVLSPAWSSFALPNDFISSSSSSSSSSSYSSSRIHQFSALAKPSSRDMDTRNERDRSRSRGRGSGSSSSSSSGKDRVDALGRLLTRILRHMASELKLEMRTDGFVKVDDLLKLGNKTFANVPLRSHTVDEIREAVRRDNKQRFSLTEENGELFIRANQGHTITAVESESLLKQILSADEVPVCVHGTYRKNLDSILESGLKRMKRLHVHFSSGLPMDGEVISGMRRDVNVLIYLDVEKALAEGMKLYVSDNKVILTEGFDGVVPVKYFEKIESWPSRQALSL